MNDNLNKGIFIVGNGPSVTQIDFRRLPKDVKILRMTNFFFENRYYAGKRVDYYIEYFLRLKNQYFNLHHLNERKEYLIDKDNIYVTVAEEPIKYFPLVKLVTPLIHQNKKIAEFRAFYENYYSQYLSTGITAIALAAVLGFKKIYIAGFDLYSDKDNAHPYKEGDVSSSSMQEIYKTSAPAGEAKKTKVTDVNSVDEILQNHPSDVQINFLNLLQSTYGDTEICSVCESSPINAYIKIGPILFDTPWYLPESKPVEAIKDWLPLPNKIN
ncbi:hypothetical protein FACS1894140_2960 [Spirochaetia bacterium]|nr:hypothetical protein FACS1894140_2960 [Spirochaetia bacterium]